MKDKKWYRAERDLGFYEMNFETLVKASFNE